MDEWKMAVKCKLFTCAQKCGRGIPVINSVSELSVIFLLPRVCVRACACLTAYTHCCICVLVVLF